VKVLTGNDLRTGAVIWWTGTDWSPHVEEADEVGPDPAAVIAREEAARRVMAAYLIDAERTADGVRPKHIKDRIRAAGPTVRADLAVGRLDPADRAWVI